MRCPYQEKMRGDEGGGGARRPLSKQRDKRGREVASGTASLEPGGVSGGTGPGAGGAVQHNTGEVRAADTWTPTTVPVHLKPYPIRFKRIKRFSN
jgi:hypothetical protein